MEPEITKTGDVVVEGHTIGRLDGFVFVADASSGGSEAKALQNAAQKALVGEIEQPRHAACRGAGRAIRARVGRHDPLDRRAVGKLVAGDEVLRPRVRLVADEHLSGAPREAVEARLDRWVKAHIEKLLGAVVRAGRGRGRDRHGPRRRVSTGRSARRARPAARRRRRQGSGSAGARRRCANTACGSAPITSICRCCSSRRHARLRPSSGSSRTAAMRETPGRRRSAASRRRRPHLMPVNKDIDALLYRNAGYRVCGERAVRVDILERLADLIRPALAWREGASGAQAAGRSPGRRLHRRQHHDVADRRFRRGFRLDTAFARLSHGKAAEADRTRGRRRNAGRRACDDNCRRRRGCERCRWVRGRPCGGRCRAGDSVRTLRRPILRRPIMPSPPTPRRQLLRSPMLSKRPCSPKPRRGPPQPIAASLKLHRPPKAKQQRRQPLRRRRRSRKR